MNEDGYTMPERWNIQSTDKFSSSSLSITNELSSVLWGILPGWAGYTETVPSHFNPAQPLLEAVFMTTGGCPTDDVIIRSAAATRMTAHDARHWMYCRKYAHVPSAVWRCCIHSFVRSGSPWWVLLSSSIDHNIILLLFFI